MSTYEEVCEIRDAIGELRDAVNALNMRFAHDDMVRDRFAMAALTAIIDAVAYRSDTPAEAALVAYEYADAMMAERRKNNVSRKD